MPSQLKEQRGIALIQVLLISAVLSVLALYFNRTAKDQITQAQWADDKALALVALHSAEANLLFNLLTQPLEANSGDELGENEQPDMTRQWNFFAKPFAIDKQVTARIQDQGGLIHAHFPDRDVLKPLILSQGLSGSQTNAVVDHLLDWQDLDKVTRSQGGEDDTYQGLIRNGAVPNTHDFAFVKHITPELARLLVENTTIYRRGTFNPTHSPKVLLAAITSQEIAEQVIELRNSGQLTKTTFSQLTGIIEDDNTFFYTSNYLAITLDSNVGNSTVHKQIYLHLKPYASAASLPLIIFSNRG